MYKSFDTENCQRDVDLLRCDIKSIEKWRLFNKLTINTKKVKLQYFPHNRNTDSGQFEKETACTVYNQELSYVNSFKYLSIEIDRNLIMKSFFEALYKTGESQTVPFETDKTISYN